jgi:molybdopterin/thiamine biosynthesis adenylyltransferase
MTRYTFTLQEEHSAALQATLLRDGREYGALLLCGRSRLVDPWTGEIEERALVRELVEVPESAFLSRTPVSLSWSTTPLFNLAKKAMERDSAICIAHSHPTGGLFFSPADDEADAESCEIIFNRLESSRPHFTMVMDNKGEFVVRAFEADLKPREVDLVRVIGKRLRLIPGRNATQPRRNALDRQARAFGPESLTDLASMRVAIVGCGGTGSAVAALLARLGVTRIALFDPDRVDETNLNRLHFATYQDAALGRMKVDVVAEGIAAIGLVSSVVRFSKFDDDAACRDALKACDVIFGCTDDHLGRNFLNRLAYFYLIPVIDLGVAIDPNDAGGYDTFDARVTVIQPGYPCQVCRQLISQQRMLEEGIRRNDAVLYEQHRRAGYINDGAEPSPAVVTFTTETATMAVNELLHRLTGFRGENGHCSERVRRLDETKDADTLPAGRRQAGCPLCERRIFDGRGDMDPFLNQL